jgi:hypothetical protein
LYKAIETNKVTAIKDINMKREGHAMQKQYLLACMVLGLVYAGRINNPLQRDEEEKKPVSDKSKLSNNDEDENGTGDNSTNNTSSTGSSRNGTSSLAIGCSLALLILSLVISS